MVQGGSLGVSVRWAGILAFLQLEAHLRQRHVGDLADDRLAQNQPTGIAATAGVKIADRNLTRRTLASSKGHPLLFRALK